MFTNDTAVGTVIYQAEYSPSVNGADGSPIVSNAVTVNSLYEPFINGGLFDFHIVITRPQPERREGRWHFYG